MIGTFEESGAGLGVVTSAPAAVMIGTGAGVDAALVVALAASKARRARCLSSLSGS